MPFELKNDEVDVPTFMEQAKEIAEQFRQGSLSFGDFCKRLSDIHESHPVGHPTEDGWCCACDYDIAHMDTLVYRQRKIEGANVTA